MYKASEDTEYYEKCQDKVKEWQLRTKEFTEENKLNRDYTREYVSKSNLQYTNNVQELSIEEQHDLEIDKTFGTIDLDPKLEKACYDVYSAYEKNSKENLLVIDKNNNPVSDVHTDDDNSQVYYSKEQTEYIEQHPYEGVTIHNHPSNSTFSYQSFNGDIENYLQKYPVRSIMVTTDNYNYYLEAPIEDIEYIRKHYDIFEKRFNDILSEFNDVLFEKYSSYSNIRLLI